MSWKRFWIAWACIVLAFFVAIESFATPTNVTAAFNTPAPTFIKPIVIFYVLIENGFSGAPLWGKFCLCFLVFAAIILPYLQDHLEDRAAQKREPER